MESIPPVEKLEFCVLLFVSNDNHHVDYFVAIGALPFAKGRRAKKKKKKKKSYANYLHFYDVNGIPASFDLLRPVAGLLDENDASEAVIEVPQVDGGHAALKVHLAVLVERSVGFHLQAP